MAPLLDVHIHDKHYGDRPVLHKLHLQVHAGEIVSLVGASGCGKSTLLRLIAGLDQDFRGDVRLDGQQVHGITRDIGFIFQEPRLFPWLTVAQNVGFDVTGGADSLPRVRELLAEVGLAGHADALPKQLSGSQAQRVAIARGLYRQPRLLLLDEPFSAVDAFTRMKLQDLLTHVVQQHGLTVVLVTHDLDEAVFLSDKVVVLDQVPGPACGTMDIHLSRPRLRDDDALARTRTHLLRVLQQTHAL
ncbi:MAG: ABC transporter ATP-binding protein [Rubrivivax sp.]|nr:MAG: ABC transporter ATP-binding protein [Rubrivivax sp.]